VLIASAETEVAVNGMPLVAGLRVLVNKDEIHVSSMDSYYFSAERLARVEKFPDAHQSLFCPRCKQEISSGVVAVRCPACGVWHHETDELNCWTYSDGCAMCGHSTEMNGTFRWTPEEL
jgi:Zn finger protein HypA/HybF involved in hydrogenase expression